MRKWLLATMLVSVLVVLAACGGNDASDTTEQGDTSGDSEDITAGQEINITGSNFEFDQEEYTVKAGEEVTINYENEEGMHGIAIDELDVDIQGDGKATFTPTEPGEYTIYCNIPCGEGHDDMTSTLIVT